MTERSLQQLDLHEIIRKRWRHFPGPLIHLLEKIIHQRELNEMLRAGFPATGSEFASRIYDYLSLSLDVEGRENIPEGRVIFASNHPLGGLDGIGLVKVLGEMYGDDNIRVLVNDMLMNVEPLAGVFLPVNKFGSQNREATQAIAEAYASDKEIVMFPAGLVSRLHPDGEIRDLEWKKSFVAKALESRRIIVPVRFEGLNRPRFYRLARLRRKLGIGFNIEQVLLPAEVCAARGKHFRIRFMPAVDPQALRAEGLSMPQIAERIRRITLTV